MLTSSGSALLSVAHVCNRGARFLKPTTTQQGQPHTHTHSHTCFTTLLLLRWIFTVLRAPLRPGSALQLGPRSLRPTWSCGEQTCKQSKHTYAHRHTHKPKGVERLLPGGASAENMEESVTQMLSVDLRRTGCCANKVATKASIFKQREA